MSETTHQSDQTNWNVEYESVEPIRIRDPVAEALTVLEPGEPFAISYADVVKEAGHSCPTASGAFRISQLGLAELYPDPDEYPVRGDVEVLGLAPEGEIAHPAADQVGPVTRVLQAVEDLEGIVTDARPGDAMLRAGDDDGFQMGRLRMAHGLGGASCA